MAALLLLWGVAFSLACRLDETSLRGPGGGQSVADRFLGASREALGGNFYEEADNYFHRGVGHVHKQAFHDSIYERWAEAVRPSGHFHADGYSVSEIMPWLRVATDMDPHNVEAYLTTAYWLATSVQRPDIAETVLVEAQRNNPGDYRILGELAQMRFGRRDDAKAAALLDAAILLWPGRQDPNDEQTRLELSRLLSYRAFLYELKGGNRQKALDLFRRAQQLTPANKGLELRVRALEAGEDLTDRDRGVWMGVFARKTVCGREDEAHDHEHDGHAHEEEEHKNP
jgi:tetratricopeptide (TPR) repeat protein